MPELSFEVNQLYHSFIARLNSHKSLSKLY